MADAPEPLHRPALPDGTGSCARSGTLEKAFRAMHRGLETAEMPGGPSLKHTTTFYAHTHTLPRPWAAAALQNGPATTFFVRL